MFGDHCNFCIETLIFEVVDFEGSYHTILGCPCYAKFLAIPNYTYLKLKMLGLNGVIMVYACGRKHFELASTVTNSIKL
jgi:hypothetical protein